MLDMAEQQMEGIAVEEETETCEIPTSTILPSQVILDPPISQCKGKRKQPQRFKPPSEPVSRGKKPRTCGICKSKEGGHNARTCPQRNVKGKVQKKWASYKKARMWIWMALRKISTYPTKMTCTAVLMTYM